MNSSTSTRYLPPAGSKRPGDTPGAVDDSNDRHKRLRTDSPDEPGAVLPIDVIQHIASKLVLPDLRSLRLFDPDATAVNDSLRDIARASQVDRMWNAALVQCRETGRVLYTRAYLEASTASSSLTASVVVAMPPAFAGHDVENISHNLFERLQSLLHPHRPHAKALMIVREVLVAAAKLASTSGVPGVEQRFLDRAPLIVLSLTHLRGYTRQPDRWDEVLDLLLEHATRFSAATQVRLHEELVALHRDDPQRLERIEAAWQRAATPDVLGLAEERRGRQETLRYPDDVKRSRLSALKEVMLPGRGEISPLYVKRLAAIAQEWDGLHCPPKSSHARLRDLNEALRQLLANFCLNLVGTTGPSNGDLLFDKFPALYMVRAFRDFSTEQQARMLHRIPVGATSLQLVSLYTRRHSADAPQRQQLLDELLSVEQSPQMRQALTDLYTDPPPDDA